MERQAIEKLLREAARLFHRSDGHGTESSSVRMASLMREAYEAGMSIEEVQAIVEADPQGT